MYKHIINNKIYPNSRKTKSGSLKEIKTQKNLTRKKKEIL